MKPEKFISPSSRIVAGAMKQGLARRARHRPTKSSCRLGRGRHERNGPLTGQTMARHELDGEILADFDTGSWQSFLETVRMSVFRNFQPSFPVAGLASPEASDGRHLFYNTHARRAPAAHGLRKRAIFVSQPLGVLEQGHATLPHVRAIIAPGLLVFAAVKTSGPWLSGG